MSITSVRIQAELEDRLDALATKLQRSKSWVINQAVREFIEKQILEQQRWQETLEALASVKRGQVVSGEAVHAWLASWGSGEELPPPKVGE